MTIFVTALYLTALSCALGILARCAAQRIRQRDRWMSDPHGKPYGDVPRIGVGNGD